MMVLMSPECSGWDIHDTVYRKELLISNKANGYRDLIAVIDLSTYRRIPWENDVPFFLVSFLDPETKEPLVVDPRGILKITTERAAAIGRECYAGVEYEVSLYDLSFACHSLHPLQSTSISRVCIIVSYARQGPNLYRRNSKNAR